jgi:hypothetical protein
MHIKKLIILVLFFFMGVTFALPSHASDSLEGVFRTLHSENYEHVTGEIYNETIFWANHVNSGVKTDDPISGSKSLRFEFDGAIGEFVTLGGTSASAIKIQNQVYRISLKIKSNDVDFLNIKIEESVTWNGYQEVLINPGQGTRLDGNGDVIDPLAGESISFDAISEVTTLSFIFTARPTNVSNLVFIAKVSGANPKVVFDDFLIEVQKSEYAYRDVVVTNFDNASGNLHESTVFWLQDGEGTTAEFSEESGIAIENRSLVFGINKIDFDVLGGSQGQKLSMKGGHTYKISLDIRLIDVTHFVMKVKRIDGDVLIHEMYINHQGQRLPGSMPIVEPEVITHDNGITHVEFEFQSLIDDNTYLFFEAKSAMIGSSVVLDNIAIEEEIYTLEYQPYTAYETIDFEGVDTLTDPLSASGLLNGISNKAYELINVSSIRGEASLKYPSLSRFQWNELFVTDIDQIVLKDDVYKLHVKAIFSGISNVKMSLVSETDHIIHEMYFNAVTLKRTQTFGKAYLDQGSIVFNNGKIYVDYLFPSLEEGMDYQWKISVYATTTTASVILDDLTFMKLSEEQPLDETLPVQPNIPEVIDTPILPGSELGFSIPSMLNGSSTVILILFGAGSVLFLGVGAFGVLLVLKKSRIIAKKAIIASLIGVTAFGIPTASFFGFVELDQTIEQVLTKNMTSLNEYQYIYPEKLSGNLNNPGMGWVALEEPTYGGHPDMGTSGDLPEVNNISLSTSWALIEVEEGVYDWTLLDQIIDYYTALDKRINFRIATDTLMLPNTYNGTPQWLFDKYNIPFEMHNYTDPGPVQIYKVVDTRNEDYRRHLSLFLEALAEKYADNDMIDVVEIRGWGNWGEWHSGYEYPTMENRMNSLQDIIDRYIDAFADTNKLLVLSAAWDPMHMPYDSYEDYYEWSAFDYLMRIDNATFRRDSGGNLLNYPTDERLLSDFFRSGKRLPLLGEYASGIGQAYNESFGFDLIGGIDDILFKMRPNYSTVLGWVNSAVAQIVDDGNSELMQRANEKLGYRLAVDMARIPKEAKQDSTMELMFSFSNSAVGRFWYDFPLKISLINDDGTEAYSYIEDNFDARTFVLGEVTNVYSQLNIPASLEDGEYTLAVSIVDDQGRPAVRLGMAKEIEDSMIYELGEINIGSHKKTPGKIQQEIEFSEVNTFKFKPKTTYAITFDYTPHFDLANYRFADTNGYVFALTSERGGIGSTVGYLKWQDVSGESGTKTIYVTTQDQKDYALNIVSEGYGIIDVHKISIEEVNGYYEHFEGYDFTDLDSLYLPVNSKVAEIVTENTLAGASSIKVTSNTKGDQEALKFDTNVYALKPNTNYTVSFKFESTSLTGKGGYMFLNLIDEESSERSRIGEWYERMDRGITTHTYNFTTGSGIKQTIAWGMKNGGQYNIDDIILIQHQDGIITTSPDYLHLENVRPDLDITPMGQVEGFEALSFNETGFDWGQFGWGQMTYSPAYVISGNSSLMGMIEIEALHNEWFEFARSKTSIYDLQPNETYNVQFSYRILKNPVQDGFFYVFMRDLSVGIASDVGFFQIPAATSADLGTVKTVSFSVTTKNYENYQFIFGMHMIGQIVIDDVVIEIAD